MLGRNPVTGEAGCFLPVGRGAGAVYLALRHLNRPGAVLVPANICFAAVYPVCWAGYTPLFADVDPVSGLMGPESVSAAENREVTAAILPHMYGNPLPKMRETVAECARRGIAVIEDCASAMDGEGPDYRVGTVGDYVIYSTGYAKTLDLGIGGFLFSRKDLSGAEKEMSAWPVFDPAWEREYAVFNRIYRLLRTEGGSTNLAAAFYRTALEAGRGTYLFRLEKEREEGLLRGLAALPETAERRRRGLRLFREKLAEPAESRYPWGEKAVPWRYNLLAEPEKRKELIRVCLREGLPVSDWYPPVPGMFGDRGAYPGAERHGERIVNFPLPLEEKEMDRIAETVRRVMGW